MSLVHRNQRNAGARCKLQKPLVIQAFRRNVQQVHLAGKRLLHHASLLGGGQRGVQKRRLHISFPQTTNLVAHKRHKRAYNKRHAAYNHSGHLVAY